MGDRKNYLIQQIVKYSQKLDQKGFVANHDGNITVKFDEILLATPTAESKGNIVSELIITVDMNGNKVDGIGKPFSELKLHLAAYHCRPDVQAVVHAHPPFSTAYGLSGLPLKPQLPEAIISIGECIPVVPFAMPGAAENESIVTEVLQSADVFIIPGNGVLAVGDNVEQAYLRLELVEHVAKIQFYSAQMGNDFLLDDTQLKQLLDKRAAIGLGPKRQVENKKEQDPLAMVKQLISEEIRKALKDQ